MRRLAPLVVLAAALVGCGPPTTQVGPYVRSVRVVDGDLLLEKCWIVMKGNELEQGPCSEERTAIPPAAPAPPAP
jgi:hypothetical protein